MLSKIQGLHSRKIKIAYTDLIYFDISPDILGNLRAKNRQNLIDFRRQIGSFISERTNAFGDVASETSPKMTFH